METSNRYGLRFWIFWFFFSVTFCTVFVEPNYGGQKHRHCLIKVPKICLSSGPSVCLPAAVHIPSFGIIIIVIYDCHSTRHTKEKAFGFVLKQNKRPLGHIQQFRNSYTKVLPMELFASQLNVRTSVKLHLTITELSCLTLCHIYWIHLRSIIPHKR